MFIIKTANIQVESQPAPPGRCTRCGSEGFHKWDKAKVRKTVDISVREIRTQRYRRKSCHKTMTAKPAGVGRATRALSTSWRWSATSSPDISLST